MRPFLLLLSLSALLCWTPPAVAGPPGQGDTIAAAIDTPSAAPLMLAVNDAPATGAAPVAAPTLPPSVATEVDALRTALAAAQGRQWFVLIGAILSIAVLVLRRLVLAGVTWLQGDRWGWVLGVCVPIAVGAVMSLAGKPFGWQTVIDCILTAGTALLTHSTFMKGIAGKPAPVPSGG